MIWMTKVELAHYLKKSTRTVERWVVQQKLPPGWRQADGFMRWRKDIVDQWLEDCEPYAKRCQKLSFSADGDIFWFKVMFYINSKPAFRQIAHMAHRCCNFVICPEILFHRLDFCR